MLLFVCLFSLLNDVYLLCASIRDYQYDDPFGNWVVGGGGGRGLTNGEDYRYHTTMVIYTQEKNSMIFLPSYYGHVVEAQCIIEPCQLHLQNLQNWTSHTMGR